MKIFLLALTSSLFFHLAWADDKEVLTEAEKTKVLEKHRDGSLQLAEEQDILSADVQDLISEQTDPKVIKLLSEVETLMTETIDELEMEKTGGETIAIETDIIETIFEAAQQKSQQSGEG